MFWIDLDSAGRLAIAARPRAGSWLVDEINRWRNSGVDIVVSLLEDHEIHELELEAEMTTCSEAGIEFISFPIVDRDVPASLTKTRELVSYCHDKLVMGQNIVVHCRAGIGRSSLIAVCVLASFGIRSNVAFERISVARSQPVPDTKQQVEWAAEFTLA